MKVTKVWVKEYASGKLLGFADVQFSLNDSDETHLTWKGFKLFQGKDGGVQIGLPSKKDEQGKQDDNGKPIYHPVIQIPISEDKPNELGTEFMEHMRSEVENAYNALKSKSTSSASGSDDAADGIPF